MSGSPDNNVVKLVQEEAVAAVNTHDELGLAGRGPVDATAVLEGARG